MIALFILCIGIMSFLSFTQGNSFSNELLTDTKILPVSASEGQFPDRILIFEAPSIEYTFDFNFTKNIRYDFFLQLFMPDVDLYIKAVLVGMDSDEDEVTDTYNLAEGLLIEGDENGRSGGFTFSCPITGEYTFTLTGTCSENTNALFSVSDKGCVSSNDKMILDVTGYHNDQERQYYINLEDDTLYTISIMRVTSISPKILSNLLVTVDLYDYEGRIYHLIRNQPIYNVFQDSATKEEFGTAIKGQYRFVVYVDTEIPITDILFTLSNNQEVGDGPEVVDPEDLGDDSNITLISISTVEWIIPFGIAFGIAIVMALVWLGKSSKKRTPRIE
jgi:hypothetical protein